MKRNLYAEFANFAADDGAAAAAPATPSAPATPPADATPSIPSTPAPSSPGVQGVHPETPATPTTPAAPSWLENLKGAGLPVGKDEPETIANLKRIHAERQAFEQVRHLLPHVQAYLAQAKDYNAWRQQQQAAPAAPVAPAAGQPNDPWWKKSWQPPEYNQAWLQQVVKDANGNLMPAPGAPPDVVMKIQQYEQFRREQAEKLLSNPFEFMAPMQEQMEARARAIAEETLAKYMESTSARQNASTFIDRNREWLFEVDATGNPVTSQIIDPTSGQWVTVEKLSPWGERFKNYAESVRAAQQQRGYQNQQEIEQLAYAQIQRDYSTWALQQVAAGSMTSQQVSELLNGKRVAPAAAAPAKDPQQAANDAFLDKKNPATPTAKGPPNAEKPITSKNLRSQLLKAFKEAGLTNETINQ